MNFLAQVEDLLRDLGSEARKKHPGVKEASERAILTLRSLQAQYVSAVRSAAAASTSPTPNSKTKHPSTQLFRSQDVLRPFLLACNYPDANAKLLTIGLNAIQLLLSGDAVCPEDSTHIARVLVIQASVSASLHDPGGGLRDDIMSSSNASTKSSSLTSAMSAASVSLMSGFSSGSSHATAPRTLKEDEAICMKLLQTLTMVAATKDLVLGEEVLSQCIMVCLILINGSAAGGSRSTGRGGTFKDSAASVVARGMLKKHTHGDKHGIRVKRAAVGTLKQVLSLAFDRALMEQQMEDAEDAHAEEETQEQLPSGRQRLSKQSTRRAAAGAFADLCALAENRTNQQHRSMAGLPPKSELHGPFSSGLLASVGGGVRHLQYVQMPPRPTCFELLNLLLSQCPSLFCVREGEPMSDKVALPLDDFSVLLRTRACPVATTTLFSEFSVHNTSTDKTVEGNGEQDGGASAEADLDFALLVRSSELASTIVNQFGVEKELCAECHILITSLMKFVSEATEGYHQTDGFEDGFMYTTAKALRDPELADSSGSGTAATPVHPVIRQPSLISNTLLWRAALALEAIYKLSQSPPLLRYLHISCDAQQLNDTLVPILAETVSDFATISASNEACIRSAVSSVRRSTYVKNCDQYKLETKLMARAREYAKFFDEWDCAEAGPSFSHSSSSSGAQHGEYATLASLEFSDMNTPVCDEGEAILLSLHCILSLTSSIKTLVAEETALLEPDAIPVTVGEEDGASESNLKSLVDNVFAPCLAVLQHYFKRFSGCPMIVEWALYGYEQLANASIPLQRTSNKFQRKALLASLCKFGLPSWGKADSGTAQPEKPLQNHHIMALLTLLRVLHKNPNNIEEDWAIVLNTLDQLSVRSVSSPKFSNDCYRKAEAVAAAYSRLGEFTVCLRSDSLQFFVSSLVDLSSASVQGGVPSFGDDESTTVSGISVGREWGNENRSGTIPKGSTSLSFFTFAGRALGVGGVTESHGESSSSPSDQVRAPMSKTYGAGLLASMSSQLPQENSANASASQKDSMSGLPFPLLLLVKTTYLNMHRFAYFGKAVIQHLCDLATECVLDYVRSFAMDTVAFLITSRFNSSSSEGPSIDFPVVSKIPVRNFDDPMDLLALEEAKMKRKQSFRKRADRIDSEEETLDINSDVTVSQGELITPLCSTITSTDHPEGAEAGLTSLYVILENTGHDIEGSTWPILIRSIAACAGDTRERSSAAWSSCGMIAFRCLKLIVDDFLDVLPEPQELGGESTRNVLLDCCASFGSSTHDVNTSLTATGMLWTIADQDPSRSTLNHVFEKLAFLASDQRAEVRNCSVNTLFSCVAGIGSKFAMDQWEGCLNGTIFGVLEQVNHFKDNGRDKFEVGAPGESLSQSSRDKRYRVNVHHSRDSAEKQWSATHVLTMRGLERLLRQFFTPLLRTTVCVAQHKVTPVESSTKTETSKPVEGAEACGSVDFDGSDVEVHQTNEPDSALAKAPWFEIAWGHILSVALSCASTPGGREILDLRLVGVDILVLCSQLASRSGIEAASTPVTVGTNMQVINGALRSVRPSTAQSLSSSDRTRNSSAESDISQQGIEEHRRKLFRSAFDALEVFATRIKADEGLQEDENFVLCGGSSTLQVLTRLSLGLSKLYECCKSEEFSQTFSESTGDFEARFVTIIQLAASKSLGVPNSKYLNQSQRTCLELLKTMSTNSSWRAFEALAILGGNSFVLKPSEKNSEDDDDDSQFSSQIARELLEIEAAKIVADSFLKEGVPNLVKASVLSMILGMFHEEREEMESTDDDNDDSVSDDFSCYDLLVPVIQGGLQAACVLENEHSTRANGNTDIQNALQETVWQRMITSLSHLLSPLSVRGRSSYHPHTPAIMKIITSCVECAPPRIHGDLGAVLAAGADHAKKIANLNFDRGSLFLPNGSQPDIHCTDALEVFRSCFAGLCQCEPESPELCSIALSALENYDAYKSRDVFFDETSANESFRRGRREKEMFRGDKGTGVEDEKYDVDIELALIVCESLTSGGPDLQNLTTSVFPLLCKLTKSGNDKLRQCAGAVLGTLDLIHVISESNQRVRQAEQKAIDAEQRIKELEMELEQMSLALENAHALLGNVGS